MAVTLGVAPGSRLCEDRGRLEQHLDVLSYEPRAACETQHARCITSDKPC